MCLKIPTSDEGLQISAVWNFLCFISYMLLSYNPLIPTVSPPPQPYKMFISVSLSGVVSDDCLMPSPNFYFHVKIYHNSA